MDCQDRSAHNQTGIKKNTIVDKSSVQMATAGRPTTRLPAILRCAAVMQPPCNFDFLFLAPPGTGPSLSRRARRANGDLPRRHTLRPTKAGKSQFHPTRTLSPSLFCFFTTLSHLFFTLTHSTLSLVIPPPRSSSVLFSSIFIITN